MFIRQRIKGFHDIYSNIHPEIIVKENGSIVDNVTFVVTQQCPLRCIYCYQHHKNDDNRMSLETAKQAIDMLFTEDIKNKYIGNNQTSAMILEFIGGEPLLEIDLIEQIIEYFRWKAITLNHRWAINHMLCISTNGVLYETPKVQQFVEKYNERLSLSISIDGNKELHDACRVFPDGSGSYDIVESAYKKYLKQSNFKSTKLTLAPENIMHLFSACEHLYNLGLQDIFANCIYEKGWELSHAKEFYSQLKKLADYLLDEKRYEKLTNSLFDITIGKHMTDDDNQNWCGGTGKMLAIDAKGMIYPCLRYVPFSLKEGCEPIVIGDIWNGIEETCEQKECVKCLKCITRRSQSTDDCYFCPIASGCAYCSAYNYEETGTPDKRVTYICIMHKTRTLCNAYFFNKLYRQAGESERFPMNIPKEWALEIIDEDEYNMLVELSKD